MARDLRAYLLVLFLVGVGVTLIVLWPYFKAWHISRSLSELPSWPTPEPQISMSMSLTYLDDPIVKGFRQLRELGAAGRWAYRRMLNSPNAQTRKGAVRRVHEFMPNSGEFVPDLLRRLDDPDDGVNYSAKRALGKLGPAASSALPELFRTAQEEQQQSDRLEAIVAITRIKPGPEWEDSMTTLLMASDHPEGQSCALEMLRVVGAPNQRTTQAVVKTTCSTDHMIRRAALETLAGFKTKTDVVEAVAKRLKENDSSDVVVETATKILGRIHKTPANKTNSN
jgi:hypothetical protein